MLEWSAAVVEVQEQFPLELEETQRIAETLNFKHPRKRGATTDMVMTTDFLITKVNGSKIALSVKPSQKLEERRVAEKLEIERQYWEERGVAYRIGTEKELPEEMVENIVWVHSLRDIDEEPDVVNAVCKEIRRRSLQGQALRDACKEVDTALGLRSGTSLKTSKHLIATKALPVDMNQKILTSAPLPIAK